jgi:hypothetical protein
MVIRNDAILRATTEIILQRLPVHRIQMRRTELRKDRRLQHLQDRINGTARQTRAQSRFGLHEILQEGCCLSHLLRTGQQRIDFDERNAAGSSA